MSRVKIGNVYPSDEYLLARCAPAGYGLGGSARHFDIEDIDDIKQSGWYYSSNPSGYDVNGVPVYFVQMRVDSWWEVESVNMVVQTLYYDVCQIRRICDLNGWRPWEWVNPPMAAGVEYRTTERWNGKPVYIMLANFGALPNSTDGSVWIGTNGATAVVGYSLTTKSAAGDSFCNAAMMSAITGSWAKLNTSGNIGVYLTTNTDASHITAECLIRYIKD